MKKKIVLLLIPIVIIILIALWALSDQFIFRPKRIKKAEQGVINACVDVYKGSISFHRLMFGTIPSSVNFMISNFEESEEDKELAEAIKRCSLKTPVDYQRRLNNKGYKLTYKDAWGKEQIEEIDFDTDYEQ